MSRSHIRLCKAGSCPKQCTPTKPVNKWEESCARKRSGATSKSSSTGRIMGAVRVQVAALHLCSRYSRSKCTQRSKACGARCAVCRSCSRRMRSTCGCPRPPDPAAAVQCRSAPGCSPDAPRSQQMSMCQATKTLCQTGCQACCGATAKGSLTEACQQPLVLESRLYPNQCCACHAHRQHTWRASDSHVRCGWCLPSRCALLPAPSCTMVAATSAAARTRRASSSCAQGACRRFQGHKGSLANTVSKAKRTK